jgi:hypothetical protein
MRYEGKKQSTVCVYEFLFSGMPSNKLFLFVTHRNIKQFKVMENAYHNFMIVCVMCTENLYIRLCCKM